MAVVLFLIFSLQSVTQVPAQTFTLDIWIDKGCGGEYHVGDMITVHWEVSHSCQLTLYEKEPDGTRRKVSAAPIITGPGQGSKGWTLGDYGYGKRIIQANATTSLYGSDSDECEFYVVEKKKEPQDTDGDGVPDDQDNCYNPGCYIVDSQGCPQDHDSDGVNDCDDDCPYDKGSSSNDGCPESPSDRDNDGVTDDQDDCYNPGCGIVDSQGCPRDSDSDGVNDCDDDCPLEYGEQRNNGCPEEDSDSDGVTDDKDSCYNPGCTLVDSRGCPWDSDNDGLTDCEDNCPNQTGPRSNNGCPTTSSPSFLLLFILLPLIAIAAIGVCILMRRRQKRTVPGDTTRIYDDDTRIY